MWNVVTYVVLALLISFLFQLALRLSRWIMGRLVLAFPRWGGGEQGLPSVRNPRAFFGYAVLVTTTVGSLCGEIIVLFTSAHRLRTGGSLWLYVPLSLVWAVTLFRGVESYQWTPLASCMLGLLLSYAGFGIVGPVVAWPIVVAVSLFYHAGGLWLVGSGSKQ